MKKDNRPYNITAEIEDISSEERERRLKILAMSIQSAINNLLDRENS